MSDAGRIPVVLLTPEVVMARLVYKDRKAFFEMCRKRGLRYIKINARVIRFDPMVVDEWLKRRAK